MFVAVLIALRIPARRGDGLVAVFVSKVIRIINIEVLCREDDGGMRTFKGRS